MLDLARTEMLARAEKIVLERFIPASIDASYNICNEYFRKADLAKLAIIHSSLKTHVYSIHFITFVVEKTPWSSGELC